MQGLSMRLFSHGACLTEKCRTIPAFVNQIPREEGIDFERQYLVDFITPGPWSGSFLDLEPV